MRLWRQGTRWTVLGTGAERLWEGGIGGGFGRGGVLATGVNLRVGTGRRSRYLLGSGPSLGIAEASALAVLEMSVEKCLSH